MRLAELQALFQADVLAGAEDGARILESVKNSAQADRTTLFGVYVNAYRARLAEFLAADFPALRALIGETAFDALADAYIGAQPSRERNARWYTTRFPEFLREQDEWRDNARAIDLALFERALTDAFDAPDAEPLAIDALGAFGPEQWPRLSFAFHPSLVLLELEAGTIATHEAAMEQQELPPPGESRSHAAVWRADLDPVHCELEADEFLALSLAMEGHAFGDICQMAAFRDLEDASPERLAQMLTGWFQEGLVVDAKVREEED
jgi:hypothetical protein